MVRTKCCKTGESRTKIFRFLEDVSAKVATESGMLLICYAVKRERKKEKCNLLHMTDCMH